MKRIIVFLGLALILSGIGTAFAVQFATGRIAGAAPIVVDGDLSDWDGLNVVPAPVSGVNSASQAGLPRNDADLSASFRCILDDQYVYLAVNVTDDALVFGEERSGMPFWDDCVEVLLYGPSTGAIPIKIWVSQDKYGKVRLEGREPQGNKSYPSIWSSKGVAAALQTGASGYRVEIMIPRSVPEQTGWTAGQALRMNMAVYDDDNGGKFESIRQWADISVQAWNEVSFAEVLTVAEAFTSSAFSAESLNAIQEIELVIDSPEGAEETIDPAVQIDLALAFERAEMYAESVAELLTAVGISGVPETENVIKLALARNYFFLNDYTASEQLCTELLAVETDNQRTLDANMILLSIEQNRTVLLGQ